MHATIDLKVHVIRPYLCCRIALIRLSKNMYWGDNPKNHGRLLNFFAFLISLFMCCYQIIIIDDMNVRLSILIIITNAGMVRSKIVSLGGLG